MTQQTLDTARSPPARARPRKRAWQFLFVTKMVIAVLIFRSFIFAFTIPSESMLPNLRNGDYLGAGKGPTALPPSLPGEPALFDGDSLPDRSDVVIFKHPVTGADYVKRVIGLPGDTLALENGRRSSTAAAAQAARGRRRYRHGPNTACRSDGGVVVDGGTTCRYRQFRETLPSGKSYLTIDFGTVGCAFSAMARAVSPPTNAATAAHRPRQCRADRGSRRPAVRDGRQPRQPLDSRFPAVRDGGVGLVDADLLVGRASRVLWSTDGSAEWLLPWTWFTAARWDRIGSGL